MLLKFAKPEKRDLISVIQCNQEINGSEYEKALWLHDWLLDQLEYDNSLKWSSSESALTRGLGTCQAYESAYSKLLSAAGIENSETRDTYDGHTWNAVKLDGEWYQVDCTWDDTDDHWYNFDQRHLYFGLTDELMALAHPGHSNIYSAVDYNTRSTSLKDNYFVKNGDAFTWSENYRDRIQENLNVNKTEFTITADNASYPPSISGIQNGIIAYELNQKNWDTDECVIDLNVIGNVSNFIINISYFSKEENKLDKLAIENKDIIADGEYTISLAVNNNFVLDVKQASIDDYAKIQIYTDYRNKNQKWLIDHDEKGYVTIISSNSNKVLSIERASNKILLYQSKYANLDTQKWIISKNEKGYQIHSAVDYDYVIDLKGGVVSNGSAIQLYSNYLNDAQIWNFRQIIKITRHLHMKAMNHDIYSLFCTLYLDISFFLANILLIV